MIIILNRLPYDKAMYDKWLLEKIEDSILITSTLVAHDFSHIPFKRIYSYPEYDSNLEVENKIIELSKLNTITAIIALSEIDVLRASKLRTLLKIPGQNYFSGSLFRDKILMKQAASLTGINIPKFASFQSLDQTSSFLKKIGFPFIIKPVDGSGSEGVTVIKNQKQFKSLEELDFKNCEGKYEVEQFIEGDMYHVDGIYSQGELVFYSVSKYYRGCLEFKKNNPLFSYIISDNHPLKSKILLVTEELLNHLMSDITSSFHLEIIITSKQEIFLCEVASRTGGSLIAKTIEMKYGLFLNEISVKLQSNVKKVIEPVTISKSFGFFIYPPKKGVLIKAPSQNKLEELTNYFESDIQLGKNYIDGADSVDSIVSGIISAEDESQLIKLFEKINNYFDINLEFKEELT